MSLGVRASKFYEDYAEGPPLEARERLLDDLAIAFDKNTRRITRKRRWLQAATVFLVVGLAVAGSMILLDGSTKIDIWLRNFRQNARCQVLPGSNRSEPTAEPTHQVVLCWPPTAWPPVH